MRKKRRTTTPFQYIIRLAITILVVAGIVVLLPVSKKSSGASDAQALSFIKQQESKDVSLVDETIRKRAASDELEGMSVWEKINYLDVYIMGDSRCVGFTYYDWDTNHILAEASTTIKYIEERIDDIANAKPANLVLSFGMNDLGMYEFDPEHYWETGEDYTTAYKEYIAMIREVSPNTKIYINLILPAMEEGIVRQDRWLLVDDWNEALKNMCTELDIPFVDITDVCYANPQYYAEDGVHLWGDLYDIWAEAIIDAVESTL